MARIPSLKTRNAFPHAEVDVTILSSYEDKEELFKEQVGQLRQRFYHSIDPGDLAANRRGVVPALGFCLSALQIWKVIRENKDLLNLPSHKGWLELEATVKSGPVPNFGMKLNTMLGCYRSGPLYSGLNCSFIFPEVACDKYSRKDVMYQHWRWQPHGHGCDLPRFNATMLLEKLRNKRLVFVGDSVNRNQWVSLVCMVEASIPDDRLKMRIFNGSLISFKALEYNATIDFYWSPLLLESNSDKPIIHRVEYRIIRADRIEKHASVWRDADIIVFNSYPWWRKQKGDTRMKVMYGSFEDGDARLDEMEMIDRFEIAIKKQTEWIGENIDKKKTRIFFAGSSPTHSWASNWGGEDSNKCLNETEPIYRSGYRAATTDYSLMSMAKSYFGKLEAKGIHVEILNITGLSEYHKDGHPTVFRKQYVALTEEQIAKPGSYADCTHWCLPGVPDVWNEFLYGYYLLVSDYIRTYIYNGVEMRNSV